MRGSGAHCVGCLSEQSDVSSDTRSCHLVFSADTTASETEERECTPRTYVEPESFFASFLGGARKKGKEKQTIADKVFFALCVTQRK